MFRCSCFPGHPTHRYSQIIKVPYRKYVVQPAVKKVGPCFIHLIKISHLHPKYHDSEYINSSIKPSFVLGRFYSKQAKMDAKYNPAAYHGTSYLVCFMANEKKAEAPDWFKYIRSNPVSKLIKHPVVYLPRFLDGIKVRTWNTLYFVQKFMDDVDFCIE